MFSVFASKELHDIIDPHIDRYPVRGAIIVGSGAGEDLPYFVQIGASYLVAIDPVRDNHTSLRDMLSILKLSHNIEYKAIREVLGNKIQRTFLQCPMNDNTFPTIYEPSTAFMLSEYYDYDPIFTYRETCVTRPLDVILKQYKVDISRTNMLILKANGSELETLEGFSQYEYIDHILTYLWEPPAFKQHRSTVDNVTDFLAAKNYFLIRLYIPSSTIWYSIGFFSKYSLNGSKTRYHYTDATSSNVNTC